LEERYLIIADDFTGANDTGVQLRRRGFPTEVLFCGKPMGALSLIQSPEQFILIMHMR